MFSLLYFCLLHLLIYFNIFIWFVCSCITYYDEMLYYCYFYLLCYLNY